MRLSSGGSGRAAILVVLMLTIAAGVLGYPELLVPLAALLGYAAAWSLCAALILERVRGAVGMMLVDDDFGVGESVVLARLPARVTSWVPLEAATSVTTISPEDAMAFGPSKRKVAAGASDDLPSEVLGNAEPSENRDLVLRSSSQGSGSMLCWQTTKREAVTASSIRLTARDPVGLVNWSRTVPLDVRAFVPPALRIVNDRDRQAPRVDPEDGLLGRSSDVGDFDYIREFGPTDDPRRINWNAVARHPGGVLLVNKTVETDLPTMTVILDCDRSSYQRSKFDAKDVLAGERDFEVAVQRASNAVFAQVRHGSGYDRPAELVLLSDRLLHVPAEVGVLRRAFAAARLEDSVLRPSLASLSGGSCVVITGEGQLGHRSEWHRVLGPGFGHVVVRCVGSAGSRYE